MPCLPYFLQKFTTFHGKGDTLQKENSCSNVWSVLPKDLLIGYFICWVEARVASSSRGAPKFVLSQKFILSINKVVIIILMHIYIGTGSFSSINFVFFSFTFNLIFFTFFYELKKVYFIPASVLSIITESSISGVLYSCVLYFIDYILIKLFCLSLHH